MNQRCTSRLLVYTIYIKHYQVFLMHNDIVLIFLTFIVDPIINLICEIHIHHKYVEKEHHVTILQKYLISPSLPLFLLTRIKGEFGFGLLCPRFAFNAFQTFFFFWQLHLLYCSWIHKFHFSATFSLKMSSMALFTYLKIILLQCFQFSVSVK